MAEGLTETAADAVELVGEEALEMAAAARELGGREVTFALMGISIGTLIGAGVGYLISKRVLETKYDKVAQEEISKMREHYQEKLKASEPKPSLKDEVQRLGYAPEPEEEVTPEVEVEIGEVETLNVFTTDHGAVPGPWDYEKEVASREGKITYIIHKDEFIQGNILGEDHEQTVLTYFSEDDVLADEKDMPIADIDDMVGLEHLEYFGHGSEDPSVVYVRNERLRLDIEINRSMGSYAKEVGGVVEPDGELEHSAMRRHRPQRGFDDD